MKPCGLFLRHHQSAVLIDLFPFPPCLLSQESCARVLLFRGASKEIRNYNSQTAFQVSQRAPGPVPPSELLVAPNESSICRLSWAHVG